MPQIVKGGKHVFGLSEVHENYRIKVPLESFYEYRLHEVKVVVLISGSEASGGFSIHTIEKLQHSRLSILLETIQYNGKDDSFGVEECSLNRYKNRIISWMKFDEIANFFLCEEMAKRLGQKVGDKLVVIRGGSNGPTFAAKGPIYEEALKHHDLELC